MDINPANPGHALVIPKAHYANVFEVDETAIAAVAKTARRIARAGQSVLSPKGLNLVQSNGEGAAQSVLHFHMHIVPRALGDELKLNWPLKPGDMKEIGALAEKIKAAI